MATTRKTKKTFNRVKATPKVSFTLPEVYGDAEFEVPDANHLPPFVAARLQKGDLLRLIEWLAGEGVDEETLGAIEGLQQDELQTFIDSWNGASGVDLPKSGS